MTTGIQRQRLDGHKSAVRTLSLSADGRILASTSTDGTALVWDITDVLKVKPLAKRPLTTAALDACWTGLMQKDAVAAQKYMKQLTAASDPAVDLLRQRLLAGVSIPRWCGRRLLN